MPSETSHSLFEALFDRRLKPTGAFADELKVAGYDRAAAKPKYLTAVWAACLEVARRHRYPAHSVNEAYREIGREFTEGFLETIPGRIIGVTVPFFTPMSFLKRLKGYFTLGRAGEDIAVELTDVREGHVVLEVRNPAAVPGGFVAGIIDTAFSRMAFDWNVAIHQKTPIHYALHVEWTKRKSYRT